MARRPSINTFVESDVSVGCPLETISVAHANNEIADCGRLAGPCLYEDGDGGTVDADAYVDGGLVMPYGLIVAGAVGIGGCAVGAVEFVDFGGAAGVDCGGCDAVGGCREDAGAVEEGGMHGEGKALRRKAFSARLEVDVMLYWIL